MANFTIVDKGIGGKSPDACWVTGVQIGTQGQPGVMFNKWVDLDTPLGPIYLCETVCKELGAAFGMVDAETAEEANRTRLSLEGELAVADESIARLEAENAALRLIVERYYTPAGAEAPVKKAAKK